LKNETEKDKKTKRKKGNLKKIPGPLRQTIWLYLYRVTRLKGNQKEYYVLIFYSNLERHLSLIAELARFDRAWCWVTQMGLGMANKLLH